MSSISQAGVSASYVEEKANFTYRDHGLKACTMNDPAAASQPVTPEAGKPMYFRVPVRTETNFATVKVILSQAASEQIANSFVGVYSSTGTRLGVSADQATPFRSSGEKSIAIVVDSEKSLVLAPGPEVFVWIAVLIGTQGTTTAQMRGASGSTTSANFNLSAGASLRCGTTGTGQSALPSSFTPGNLTVAAGPMLIGA